MTQNIVNYANNPDGPELLDDYLAKQQQNELTSNSGIQRPSYVQAGTKWLDTSSTPWVWKMFDGTSDVVLGRINPSEHAFSAVGLDAAVLLTGDQTVGGTKTFSNNPLVPNVTSGDSSSKVANTAFVTSVASGLQTQINTKVNTSDLATVYAVVETYNNDGSWYRIYSDGWCEQGGTVYVTSQYQLVNLNVPFTDTTYTAVAAGATLKYGNVTLSEKTTSTFKAWVSDDDSFNAGEIQWIATGFVGS